MNFKIIAFAGKAQAGKSTAKEAVKEILQDDNEYTYESIFFAQKLKEIAFELFGWDGDKEIYYPMTGTEEEMNTPIPDKGRQLLINIGKFMREIRPTVWADYVYNKIKEDIDTGQAKNKVYVIDDMRFKNEIEVLKRFDTSLVTIKVDRRDSIEVDDISEKDLEDFADYTFKIENNDSKEDLKKKLTPVVNQVLLPAVVV